MVNQQITNNRIAIIGASGYGGLQVIRLLRDHPLFVITYLGGHRSAGKSWNSSFPYIPLDKDLIIQTPNIEDIAKNADYAILSLPNGMSSQLTPKLLERNIKVIDLSADYRFRSLDNWKKIYSSEARKYKRNDYKLCENAVYGISELFSDSIKNSNLIACPGCFPTASILSISPFLTQGLIDTEWLVIDAKTGTSGGGRIPKEHLLLSECADSISPYGVIGHRHTSEIEEITSLICGKSINLQFTPHLVPMVRGILTTTYARLRDPGLTAEDCTIVLEAYYKDQPFIKVLPTSLYPSTKWVKNTNLIMISVQVDKRNGRMIIMSVIDNLLKGQAGQAIQNVNLMAGYEQDLGLPKTTFYP